MIARNFAFIFGRNLPSLGLLGITISDDAFFEAAKDGEVITVDTPSRSITVAGLVFPFILSDIEYSLTMNNGIAKSYNKFGKGIWDVLSAQETGKKSVVKVIEDVDIRPKDKRMEW